MFPGYAKCIAGEREDNRDRSLQTGPALSITRCATKTIHWYKTSGSDLPYPAEFWQKTLSSMRFLCEFLMTLMKESGCMHQEFKTTFEAGDTLDHYRLEATVAQSGMSTLYRATDLRDGKQVVLKIPHAEMEADPVLLERFKREEEIGQHFHHPGIVKTFDGEHRSRLYMVMEWVDGRGLRAILNEQAVQGERKLPIERAVKITLGICNALDYLHKHGVVHRDLKPENVMVDGEGHIKLIDFGSAMKEDARRLTFAGSSPMLGTPAYISPEQVKGHRGDQRSDIYAVGAMLYEMLTGGPPFTGSNPLDIMNERLLTDATPARQINPEISPQLQEILFRALERDPHNRYATSGEMAWELEHQEHVSIADQTRRPVLQKRVLPGGRKILLYAGMALVPLLLLGLMMMLAQR
jgi:serine/threonine protein kinase